jgi:serine protease Do
MRVWIATIALACTAATGPAAGAQTIWDADDLLAFAGPEAVQAVRMLASAPGGRIGVTIRDLTDEDAKTKAAAGGVAIEEVEPDSPAAKAGFKAGDVVVEFDGERVRSSRQFSRLVQESANGRTVTAAVVRDGQRVTLNVQPREGGGYHYFEGFPAPVPPVPPTPPSPPVPPTPRAFKFDSPVIGRMFGGRLGVSVSSLSPQLADYFGVKEGALVTSVNDASAAAKAGVKAGDVIIALDGSAVADPSDLSRRTQRLENGAEFTLSVVRDKKTVSLKGKLEASTVKRSTRTVL